MADNYLVKSNTPVNDLPNIQRCKDFFNALFFDKMQSVKVWIAGGCIRDFMLKGRLTKTDVDFFSSDRKELAKCVRILRKEFNFQPYLISKNAIKGWCEINGTKQKVDIVKVLFADMQSSIDGFDFTVCCFAVSSNNFVYHPSAPFDLMVKRLVINSLPFPMSTLQRMQKYIKKGYWICNGGMLEISKALSTIDFTNPEQNTLELYPDGSPRFVRYD